MKAQELRIGNWVYVYEDGHNTYTKIKGVVIVGGRKIDGYSSDFVYHDFGSSILTDRDGEELVSPIPLTPEILEKFGFELRKEDETSIEIDYKLYPLYVKFEHNEGLLVTIHEYSSCSHVKYLHQLQNLIHSLTGEELEFKP